MIRDTLLQTGAVRTICPYIGSALFFCMLKDNKAVVLAGVMKHSTQCECDNIAQFYATSEG